MFEFFLGFFELGGMILAWMLIWNWLTKGIAARYPDSPAAQALAGILHC